MDSPKPVPATFKANAIGSRVLLMCLDIKNLCRASILRYSPYEWVAACAADQLEQAHPGNVTQLDFVWVNGKTPTTATRWQREWRVG